jgi:hypothetical protein
MSDVEGARLEGGGRGEGEGGEGLLWILLLRF